MSKVELRPHQKQIVESVLNKFNSGERFALVVAAVASGKSYAAAAIAKEYKRVVVLQPSIELMKQNHKSFENLGIQNEMINGNIKGDWGADVILTTANTLSRNLDKLEEPDLLIIDELHLQHWGKMRKTIMRAWQKCKVFGMTATPHYYVQNVRYKNGAMYSVTTCCAIADGYFGEPVYKLDRETLKELGYGTDIRLEQVKITKAREIHFASPDMYWYVINKHLVEVQNLLRLCENAIIYCDGIKHAKFLAENIQGVECIFGETPAKQRKEIVERFMKNETKYIATVGCLKLGFDKPDLKSIIILTNVNNPSNAEQQIGRLNRGTGTKYCYYNSKLNTMEPVVGAEVWTEIKHF